MKKLFSVLMFIAIALSITCPVWAGPCDDVKSEEVVFRVGMRCGNCKAKIEKTVYTQEGVMSASADVSSKLVTVRYDPSLIDETRLMASITNLDFTCEKVDPTQLESSSAPLSEATVSGGGCSAKGTTVSDAATPSTKSGGCCSAKSTASTGSPSEKKSGGCCGGGSKSAGGGCGGHKQASTSGGGGCGGHKQAASASGSTGAADASTSGGGCGGHKQAASASGSTGAADASTSGGGGCGGHKQVAQTTDSPVSPVTP